MRYDAEHKQTTHQRVLKAAADAIRVNGPHRVGVAGVMAKAGLTHGGFYAHFDSKDALVTEAINEMFGQGRARFAKQTANGGPDEALWSYIRFYLSRQHRDSSVGCPVPALLSDARRVPGAAREALAEGAQRLRNLLAEALHRRGQADAETLADSVLAELVGALALARAEPDSTRSDEILMRSRLALKARLHLQVTP